MQENQMRICTFLGCSLHNIHESILGQGIRLFKMIAYTPSYNVILPDAQHETALLHYFFVSGTFVWYAK